MRTHSGTQSHLEEGERRRLPEEAVFGMRCGTRQCKQRRLVVNRASGVHKGRMGEGLTVVKRANV